jgi:sugar phosphate isomerase/epimerase
MSENRITFTVFTKPWKFDIPALARHVAGLGFDGIELPVRPGYPVDPENVGEALPRAARTLAAQGVAIVSIAGPTDERTIAACGTAGVPVIRICVSIRRDETYDQGEARLRREFDAIVPYLDRHGVTLGIQNHCGRDVCNAMGLHRLLAGYDPKHVAAVWDAAHNALQGEEPELALDIVWPLLCMVNLKNAFWQRTNGPEAEAATWRPSWTIGRHGLASWPRVAAALKTRGYVGPVCLTAEYDDHDAVDRLIAEDLAFARALLAEKDA